MTTQEPQGSQAEMENLELNIMTLIREAETHTHTHMQESVFHHLQRFVLLCQWVERMVDSSMCVCVCSHGQRETKGTGGVNPPNDREHVISSSRRKG